MKEIPLADGSGVALVDDEDFERVSQYRWVGHVGGYVRTGARGTRYLHRFILDAPDGALVDHIDGDKLNNCRSNLRLVNARQNGHNRRASVTCRSGVRGVFWDASRQRYVALVQMGRRKVHQSRHRTLEEAERAVKDARRRLMSHSPEAGGRDAA